MANRNNTTAAESPKDVHTTVRLPADLHTRLAEIARAEDRSVSAEVRRAVAAYVEAQSAETATA